MPEFPERPLLKERTENAKELAESGLALLDSLDALERAEGDIVAEALRVEEQKKIDMLKKQLGK